MQGVKKAGDHMQLFNDLVLPGRFNDSVRAGIVSRKTHAEQDGAATSS
jgi:hypothetical protein